MIDLDLVKTHLRIDYDHDDDYLNHLIRAASQAVCRYCDRQVVETQEELDALNDPDAILSNHMIDHAKLMLIAHWYAQRESVSASAMHEVPQSVDLMLDFYRRKSL